jgi:uncharacterized membrane-anchored protein
MLESHPLRPGVLAELHARPFQLVGAPRRLLHAAFATDAAAVANDRAALAAWCRATGVTPPDADANFHRVEFPTGRLRWERHSEFTTYGWDVEPPASDPFGWPLSEPFPVGAGIPQPGPLVAAIDLALVAADGAPDPRTLFDPASLCLSHVRGAEIATDFRQDPRGFTRILVIDHGLGPAAAGALVQRLIEVEMYRSFALLGLPEAQRLSPIIGRIERELVAVAERMRATTGLEENASLLDALVALAAELEAESVRASYRFGATQAYEAIVTSRLEVIAETPVEGHATWRSFLDRRLAPAMRTCRSVAGRQADLAQKLARASNLLRTRVDVEMESQNRALLEGMSERARVQLRLQQTVEGLSVAAVSYYVLGLVGYLAKGAKDAGFVSFEPGIATAVALPVVVAGVWWTVRRVRGSNEG